MKAWQDFLKRQEVELGRETVARWLYPLKVTNFDAGNLYLQARDSFQAAWFEEHIRKRIDNDLRGTSGRKIRVHLSVASDGVPQTTRQPTQRTKEERLFELRFDDLDPNLCLDTFVATEEDLFAPTLFHKLCSKDPAERLDLATFNPIYLYGESGSGKTHLMMAVTAALREQGKRTLYVRAETFTEHVVRAIRVGQMREFREAYRKVEVLLVDGVQIFGGKAATQEELFHTFNHLHLQGCQLVFSGDCAPGELEEIEPRLVSRFEWGVVLSLPAPITLRQAILEKKANVLGVALSPELIEYMARTFSSSTHALVRALEALVLRSHMHGRGHGPLTLLQGQHHLRDLIEEEIQEAVTHDTIVARVAAYYGLARDDLLGKSQKKECSGPRQVAMYLCRTRLQMAYPQIGKLLHRDHSTIMSGVRKVEERLNANDHEFAAEIHAILRGLKNHR